MIPKDHLITTQFSEILKHLIKSFPLLALLFILSTQSVQAQEKCYPAKQVFEFGRGVLEKYDFVFIGIEVVPETSSGPNAAMARLDLVYRFPLLQNNTPHMTTIYRETLKRVPYDSSKPTVTAVASSDILEGLYDENKYFNLPTSADLTLPNCP